MAEGKPHSPIAVSKLAVADLHDPKQSLLALLKQTNDALERFLTQPIDEIWQTGVVELSLEALQGVNELTEIIVASPAKLSHSTTGHSSSGLLGSGHGQPHLDTHASEGIVLELNKVKRRVRTFAITLATFGDIGRLRPDTLTFQDWCEVRRDAFDLVTVLELVREGL